jgi:hypothetical protein
MSPPEQTRQPFYEHRAFKGTAAVVALVTALLALVGPLRDAIDGVSPDPTKRTGWTEVILNTSEDMGQRFGDGDRTRLDSAIEGIAQSVLELDNSNVGLLRTSSRCDGKSEPLVDLADGTSGEVIEAAEKQLPDGEANIAGAIIGALDEFERKPMREHGPQTRSLLIFTSASEPCPWEDPTGAVERRLKEADHGRIGGVDVLALSSGQEAVTAGGSRMELAALTADPEGSSELAVIAALLGPQTVHYVDTPEELYEQAEEAGEEVRETVEEIDDEEGGSGTSDEGVAE